MAGTPSPTPTESPNTEVISIATTLYNARPTEPIARIGYEAGINALMSALYGKVTGDLRPNMAEAVRLYRKRVLGERTEPDSSYLIV